MLSYLNQIISVIWESERKACVVLIGKKDIPIMLKSLIDETWHIRGVRVYQYEDEYFAAYREMSKEFKIAYVFKDDSIFVYDFDRINEFCKTTVRKNLERWLRPSHIFIDEAV